MLVKYIKSILSGISNVLLYNTFHIEYRNRLFLDYDYFFFYRSTLLGHVIYTFKPYGVEKDNNNK